MRRSALISTVAALLCCVATANAASPPSWPKTDSCVFWTTSATRHARCTLINAVSFTVPVTVLARASKHVPWHLFSGRTGQLIVSLDCGGSHPAEAVILSVRGQSKFSSNADMDAIMHHANVCHLSVDGTVPTAPGLTTKMVFGVWWPTG